MADKTAKMEKIVAKAKWKKLDKLVKKSVTKAKIEDMIAIANACGTTSADEAYNSLIALVRNDSADVQVAALNALGKSAGDRAVATLNWMMANTAEDKPQVVEAARAALKAIKARTNRR